MAFHWGKRHDLGICIGFPSGSWGKNPRFSGYHGFPLTPPPSLTKGNIWEGWLQWLWCWPDPWQRPALVGAKRCVQPQASPPGFMVRPGPLAEAPAAGCACTFSRPNTSLSEYGLGPLWQAGAGQTCNSAHNQFVRKHLWCGMVENPLHVLKTTRQPAVWAMLCRWTWDCQQIPSQAVTIENGCCTLGLPSFVMMTVDAGTSFCRMVGLKTGIKTGVAYPLAAVNVAGSLEFKFHFHFLFPSSPAYFSSCYWCGSPWSNGSLKYFCRNHADSVWKKA